MGSHLYRAVVCVLALGGAAVAQGGPAGPVVYHNNTGVPITLTNFRYTDGTGAVTQVDGEWKLVANFRGYLLIDNKKFSARKIEYDLVTEDGKTTGWASLTANLDTSGNFINTLSPQNLTDHRRMLGKAALNTAPAALPVPVGLPAPVPSEAAWQEVNRLEGQLREASNRVLAARVAVGLAQTAYNRTEPGTGPEFAASIALGLARRALSEVESEERGVESALRAARDRANSGR